MEYAYRYRDIKEGIGDEYSYRVRVVLTKYQIIKHTAKGIWIEIYPSKKRFVLLTAKKKYACLTEDEALKQFVLRKRRQIAILKNNIRDARLALIIVGVDPDG